MDGNAWLAFAAGVLVGAGGFWLLRRFIPRLFLTVPDLTISNVTCLPGGKIQIDGGIDPHPPPEGWTLVSVHSHVYDDPDEDFPVCPSGALLHAVPADPTAFSLVRSLPGGLGSPTDLAVVWAVYQVCRSRSFVYNTCSPTPPPGPPP